MLSVTVRVVPQGGADHIESINWAGDGHPFLKVRVIAPPEDGKANEAVMKLLAKALDIRKADIHLFRGHRCRTKIFKIADQDGDLKLRFQKLDIS